jgi:TRAP-type C4-dicarboxylate transport system permease small subunit
MIRAYDRLLDALAAVAAFLVLALMVGVGIDVGGRYVLGRPIGWMSEMAEHSLICILFLGMAWLAREQGHVAIELAVEHAPARMRHKLKALAAAIAGLTSLFLTWWAVLATHDNYTRGVETFGIYPIHKYLLLVVATVGLGLTGIEFLRRAVVFLRDTGKPPEAGHPAITAEP